MKIEKNWNKTNVTNFKVDLLEQLVLQCYKYQKFTTKAALSKINRGSYAENTVKQYLDCSKIYLNYGTRKKAMSNRLYDLLDKYKAAHVGILEPKEHERYKPCPNRRNIPPTPQQQTPQPQQTPQTPTNYAIKINNTIKVFSNKEFCLGYIECFTELNKDQKAELVTINYELVKENNEENNNDGNA
jgi:hypothetical protein